MFSQEVSFILVCVLEDDTLISYPVESETFSLPEDEKREWLFFFFYKKVITKKENGDIVRIEFFQSNTIDRLQESKKTKIKKLISYNSRVYLDSEKRREFLGKKGEVNGKPYGVGAYCPYRNEKWEKSIHKSN